MAGRSNLSINEIMSVLDKTGLSSGNSFQMGQNRVGAPQAVEGEIYGRNQGMVNSRKQAYLAQLDKIAQVDQKLAGVYGDPTSPLYIEHAGKRQGIIDKSVGTAQNAAEFQGNLLEDTNKNLENEVSDTLKVFSDLITKTKAQETEVKRQEAEQKKAQKEAEKSKLEVKTKKGSTAKTTITKTQKTKFDEAGIDPNNPQIRAIWNNSPSGFQNWFIEKRATGKIKDKVIGPRELSYWRGQYAGNKVKNPAKKTTSKSKGLSAEEIKQLSAQYKK